MVSVLQAYVGAIKHCNWSCALFPYVIVIDFMAFFLHSHMCILAANCVRISIGGLTLSFKRQKVLHMLPCRDQRSSTTHKAAPSRQHV